MGRLPAWYKGRKLNCDICDDWRYELDGKMRKQRGLNVCEVCYDKLTDQQRAEQLRGVIR